MRWEKTPTAPAGSGDPRAGGGLHPGPRWQQPFVADHRRVPGPGRRRRAGGPALDVELTTGEQQQLAEKPTSNLAAYDAFLRRGRRARRCRSTTPRRSAGRFPITSGLSHSTPASHWPGPGSLGPIHSCTPIPSAEGGGRGSPSRRRAGGCAGAGAGHGHLALAGYYRLVLNDPAKAAAEYAERLRLEPGNLDMLAGAAANARNLGLWDSALAQARRVTVLNPVPLSRSGDSARPIC